MFTRTLASLLLLATACDNVTDDDYQGELLATLNGTVTNSRTAATPPTQALVFWASVTPDPSSFDLGLGGAAIEGSFPAAFRIDVTTPPPEDLSIDGSGDLALGSLWVAPQRDHILEVEDIILGIEEDHALLWVGTEAGADQAAARWNMTVEPGMHVVDVLGLSLEEDIEYRACLTSAQQAGEDLQPCFDAKRATLMSRYPEVEWSVVDEASGSDHFRLAADDLDAELSIGLKDTMAEINFPQFPYPDMN